MSTTYRSAPRHEPRERRRPGWRSRVALLGPAFVAAVAYVDPGNFATNIDGGATYGYRLVWVIVIADLMALLVQYLSAKLGLATGSNLAQVMGRSWRPSVRRLLWVQAEVVAMATDLAEFVGAALGLALLFGVPLLAGGAITAVVAFGILALQQRGYRPFERAIAALLGLVAAGFVWDTIAIGHQSGSAFARGLVPTLSGSGELTLTLGIIGATVMPHVIYLHSALTQDRISPRTDGHRRFLLRWVKVDVLLGLGAAGVVNLLMMIMAAVLFHRGGGSGSDTIQAAHSLLGHEVGGVAAVVFAAALLASGLASSSVGTFAGQVVMSGLLRRSVPLVARRALTMIPALIVLGLGVSVTRTLVISQVILSFGIPFAAIPLLVFTSRASVMGPLVNSRTTVAVGTAVVAVITGLNVYLLVSAVV